MAQNLKAAMAMEKVYRKLQDNRVAKDAFGYQDKLKRFGWVVAGDFERIDEKMRLPIPTIGIKLTELRPMSRIFSNSKKLMG